MEGTESFLIIASVEIQPCCLHGQPWGHTGLAKQLIVHPFSSSSVCGMTSAATQSVLIGPNPDFETYIAALKSGPVPSTSLIVMGETFLK